jgi:hypothetical protein
MTGRQTPVMSGANRAPQGCRRVHSERMMPPSQRSVAPVM